MNNENAIETPIVQKKMIKLLLSSIDAKPNTTFYLIDYLIYFVNIIFYPLKKSESISSIRFELDPFSKKIYWIFVIFCLAYIIYYFYSYIFVQFTVVFFKILFSFLTFIMNSLKLFFGYKKDITLSSKSVLTLEQEYYICYSVYYWILMFVFILLITKINGNYLKYNVQFVIPSDL